MIGVVAVRNARTVSKALADLGQRLYARGWVLGTSGNFSEVVSRRPLRLAITASGLNKRTLRPSDILTVDGNGKTSSRRGRPSAETLLHVTIARLRGAGAVVHTHSIHSTVLSDIHADAGGFHIRDTRC
jgi:methylthioribulose-1-phosphate dehydratase